jgi:hypothetical protein
MKNVTGRFLNHSWKCCGKSRGRAKFCPECGAERPPANDVSELLAFFQRQRDASEKTANTWKIRAEELMRDRAEMLQLVSKCLEFTDDEFGKSRVLADASREAKRYVQSSWKELSEDKYERTDGTYSRKLIDPYRVLTGITYTDGGARNPSHKPPEIEGILADGWNGLDSEGRMRFLLEQARLELMTNEIPADSVAGKLNSLYEGLSQSQRSYFYQRYWAWAIEQYFMGLSDAGKLRFLTARVLERRADIATEKAECATKSSKGAAKRAETFEAWIKIVSDLALKVEQLSGNK